MRDIRIAAAQFEHVNGDKNYNIQAMESLAAKAAEEGAKIICFHELCITGYTWLRHLRESDLFELAEHIPESKSITALTSIARQLDIAILAGLVEKEKSRLYNTVVCVTRDGLVAKHRKLHPFISSYLSAGDNYAVFDLFGIKCGILICYDNNVIENVRATALLGVEVLFAPHVTGCTPSPMPGRGYVDPALWYNRENDPVSLRLEFDGRKHREWLLRWLPARAYDNGIYVIFSNPIGMDDGQLKGGASMIIDPFGDILAECRELDDQVVIALCTTGKIEKSGGYRYRRARRPELYGTILSARHNSETKPVWLKNINS
mgnify:CR=1 FL=1